MVSTAAVFCYYWVICCQKMSAEVVMETFKMLKFIHCVLVLVSVPVC